MKRIAFWQASAVQEPPSKIGSEASTATGRPSSRAKAVMTDRPNQRPISKNEPLSNSGSITGRTL